MAISKEIKQVRAIVLDLLTNHPKYRDSDKMLCARIWAIQMGGTAELQKITAYDFLTEFVKKKSKLFNVVSIVRVRRKIQEENPELQGTKWKERNEEQAEVTRALGYDKNAPE